MRQRECQAVFTVAAHQLRLGFELLCTDLFEFAAPTVLTHLRQIHADPVTAVTATARARATNHLGWQGWIEADARWCVCLGSTAGCACVC